MTAAGKHTPNRSKYRVEWRPGKRGPWQYVETCATWIEASAEMARLEKERGGQACVVSAGIDAFSVKVQS